jgi:hypothetical protein
MNRRGVIAAMGFLSFLFGKSGVTQQPALSKDPANAGRDLRQMILSTSAAEFGAKPTSDFPRVYGVLMDWPIGENFATIFSSSSGAASLYTTSTFGIIGGEGHAAVRTAAITFVQAADRLYDSAAPTSVYPYPASDRVRFYLLTFEGVRVVETDFASISSRTNNYVEYFDLGQAVLTELRLVTERR